MKVNTLMCLRLVVLLVALLIVFATHQTLLTSDGTSRKIGVEIDVTSTGAVGDGVTDNAEAIQRTIDARSALGGGTVRVPVGNFVSGTIQVKDGACLKLDEKVSVGERNPH